MKKLFLNSVIAFIASLLSNYVPSEVIAVIPSSTDCQSGCTFVAAGWPFVYLLDRHGHSPAGPVSVLMGFLGEDYLRKADFWLTFFWLVVSVYVHTGLKRWRIGK